jgi:curved DNA-binding protein CbpA
LMPTFYELLQISPQASGAEIDSAYESQYDTLRRLVNHPTQGLTVQQKLAQLEVARLVLTDPGKRSAYDAELNVRTMGGLADPFSAPAPVSFAVAPPPATGAANHVGPRTTRGSRRPSLWECSECAAENPPNTQFCLSCDAELVRECPECRKIASLVSTGFCGGCGVHFDTAARRAQLSEQQRALSGELTGVKAALQSGPDQLGGEFATLSGHIAALHTQHAAIRKPGTWTFLILLVASWFLLSLLMSRIAYELVYGLGPTNGTFIVNALPFVLALLSTMTVFGLMRRPASQKRAALELAIELQRNRWTALKTQRDAGIQQRIDELTSGLQKAQQEFEQLSAPRRGRTTP